MRKVLALVMFLTMGIGAYAQEDEPQTPLALVKKKRTVYGGLITEFSAVRGQFVIIAGGGGAMLLTPDFFIGGYGCGLITELKFPDIYPANHNPITNPRPPDYKNLVYSFGHGGVWTGYTFYANKAYTVGTSLRLGGGQISLADPISHPESKFAIAKDYLAVIQHEFNIEVQIAWWMRLRACAGYRFIGGIDNNKYTAADGSSHAFYKTSDLNSPYGNLTFVFGWFGAGKQKTNENINMYPD